MQTEVQKKGEYNVRNFVLFAIACICACLTGVNVSGIAAVLDVVQADFGVDLVTVGWIMSIYSLITYPSMILIGRIADLIGFKRAIVASCVFELVGSVVVIVSPNVPVAIIGRILQGVGSGGLPTTCISLVAKIFPSNRQKMVGLAVNVFPLAQIIGSNFGVWVTDLFGTWRGIYWFNVIIMVVAIAVFFALMPKDTERDGSMMKQIDVVGAVLMCGAVFALMVAITDLKTFGSAFKEGVDMSIVAQIAVFFVAFLVLGYAFIRWVKKAEYPIVDREVLFSKKFTVVTAFFFCYGFVALGFAQMIPTWAKTVLGFSSEMAALIVLMKGVGWFLVGIVIAMLIKKLGYRIPLLMVIVLIAVCYAIMGFTSLFPETAEPDYAKYIWLYAVATLLGCGSGAASPTMTNVAIDLMPENVGTIYGVTAAFRQIGSTLCVPIVTVIVALFGDNLSQGWLISYLVMSVMILLCLLFVFKMPARPTDPEREIKKGGH